MRERKDILAGFDAVHKTVEGSAKYKYDAGTRYEAAKRLELELLCDIRELLQDLPERIRATTRNG